jgi:pimeloyl-ACP methyl ester carboxylesterase
MPYAEVNDIRMYYEEQGQGHPLILLHGGTGAIESMAGWGPLLPSLTPRYRAFSPEHRGHGRTSNPAGYLSFALIADDIAKFIEQLGLAPAHVAGVSDGAMIGLALAMTRPDLLRSLICVGANYRIDDQLRDALEFFDVAVIERDHPEYARTVAARHDPHRYPGYWRDLVRQVREASENDLVWTEDDLRRIPALTLLIAGEADFIVSLDQKLAMHRSIPDSEMLILNRVGQDGMANHLVQFTRPDVVGPVILDFLERHAGHPAE